MPFFVFSSLNVTYNVEVVLAKAWYNEIEGRESLCLHWVPR